MAPRECYVSVPPRSPRKRRPSPSPTPSDSSPSSKFESESPKKQIRGDKDVDVTTSRFLQFALNRPRSPTASDFDRCTVPEDSEHEESDEEFDPILVDPESPKKRIQGGTSRFFQVALQRPCSPTASDFDRCTIPEDPHSGDELDPFNDCSLVVDEDLVEENNLSLRETAGEGLPIRRLSNFTFFECAGMKPIDAVQLLGGNLSTGMYRAVGTASAEQVDTDDDEMEDDSSSDTSSSITSGLASQRVQITIVELNVHDYNDPENGDDEDTYRDPQVDQNIYIRTEQAWYILDTPSPEYEPFWNPFARQHALAHRVLTSSLINRETTYDDFVESLDADVDDEVLAYVIRAIDDAVHAGAPIGAVPLVRTLFPDVDDGLSRSPSPAGLSRSPSPNGLSRSPSPDGLSRSSLPVQRSKRTPNQDSQSFATPVVGRVGADYAKVSVVIDQTNQRRAHERLEHEVLEVLEHHEDPETMHWKDPIEGRANSYSGVVIDGVTYTIGDVVAVAKGEDGDTERANKEKEASAHCRNNYADSVWFVKIMYFFEQTNGRGHPEKMFHGQWLTHGSRTFLEEVVHSQELFLLLECIDNAVATILQMGDVRFLGTNEVEEEPDSFDAESRTYFCRLVYDDTSHDFEDLPSAEDCDRLREAGALCANCVRKDEHELLKEVRVVGEGLAQFDRTFHVHDFVYVKPDIEKRSSCVLFIAQITSIDCETQKLRVKYWKRYTSDPRRLYRTRDNNNIGVDDIDGTCFVRHFSLDERDDIEEWVDNHPDHFYANERMTSDNDLVAIDEEDFEWCTDCFDAHMETLEEAERYVRRNDKIQVFEVFSGAGGLSQGLHKSKFFNTKWAVERSIPAAETFKLNHPETNVLCADINDVLRYAAGPRDGKIPLKSCDKEGTIIPDSQVPRPQEFGLLCGGPPCQSFSGANGNKVADDPRSSLPLTMLSLAEIYKPDYFLLENVTGLLQHSVSNGDGLRIEKAMLKTIVQILIALGYQCKYKILQAGQYGSPQDRQRIIFFGTKRGLKAPNFPDPTHAFYKSAQTFKLSNSFNDTIPPVKRGRASDDMHIFAPHAAVTIKDAIGDLPPFDWISPHEIMAETPEDQAEVQARAAQGIRQCDPSKAFVGFCEPVPYATVPKTRYQQAMRSKNQSQVKYHYTDRASSFVVEASTRIPLEPNADHKSLPPAFFESRAKLTAASKSCFGRLDANGPFKTAMTTVQPRSRGSCVLHPSQKRPLSVVEAKRGQGFPDDFILWSDKQAETAIVKDYYRHIGNAVPVPLAEALARSLREAFLHSSSQNPRAGSPSL